MSGQINVLYKSIRLGLGLIFMHFAVYINFSVRSSQPGCQGSGEALYLMGGIYSSAFQRLLTYENQVTLWSMYFLLSLYPSVELETCSCDRL
jgi:hypothetical protein